MDSNTSDPTSSSTGPGATIRGTHGSFSSSSIGNGPSYAFNGKIMLCTVIILFVAIVIILGFHSYAWRLLSCCRRRRRSRHPSNLLLHQAAAPALQGGLDVSVLKSLHTFTFNTAGKNQDNLGDCPVCLSEFEDGEAGRALPRCGHAFHAECIDMWFQTHSNCPLCRAPVQARSDSDVVSANAAAISSPSHGNENGDLSSINSPVELVGISVEAPPSMEERFKGSPEELGSGSGGDNQAKSLGKPVLSMKRIWST